jgi:addiction module HigA family antidote
MGTKTFADLEIDDSDQSNPARALKVFEPMEQLERLEPNRKEFAMTSRNLAPIHPGRILLEEFLAPRGISVWHLAKDIDVPVRRVCEIIQGQRPITPPSRTAWRTTSVSRNGTGSTCRSGSMRNETINASMSFQRNKRYGTPDREEGRHYGNSEYTQTSQADACSRRRRINCRNPP